MKCLSLIIAFLIPASLLAQINTNITSASVKLPPFEELVEAAVNNSPHVKQQDALYLKNDYIITSKKQQWLTGLKFNMELGSGNQALLIQQAVGTVESYSNLNNGYRATVNVGLSVFDMANRRPAIKIAEYDKKASFQQREILIQELRLTLLTRYQNVLTGLRILDIKSEAKQVTKLTRTMAEKEFSEGKVPIAEMSRIIEIATTADSDYEAARQFLIENVRVLEILTGKKIL